MPATTAVHFPLQPGKPLEHRRFSPETFLGAVSYNDRHGTWGMILTQPIFHDGRRINLHAYKSAFFVDNLMVLLGSGITGGDGIHAVETTLFQSFLDKPELYNIVPSKQLVDPVGNGYYIPDTNNLKVFTGTQNSYHHNGRTPTSGDYAVAWLDHGRHPQKASYEVAILVRGGDWLENFAQNPQKHYRVVNQTTDLHQVEFPTHRLSGFVFFKPEQINDPIITSVDEPCLVMYQHLANNRIRLSVTNPDLGLLDVDAPAPPFRFVSQNENQYRSSQPRPVQVILRGHWRFITPSPDVTMITRNHDESILRFNCLHGMSIQTDIILE